MLRKEKGNNNQDNNIYITVMSFFFLNEHFTLYKSLHTFSKKEPRDDGLHAVSNFSFPRRDNYKSYKCTVLHPDEH